MSRVTVTATSLDAALRKVKKYYGPNALIESTTDSGDAVSLVVMTDFSESNQPNHNAIIDKNPQPIKYSMDSVRSSPMDAIRLVCDLCDYHLLDFYFCDTWLKHLTPYLTQHPIHIDKAMSDFLLFNPGWLDSILTGDHVIIVGPSGAGKTSILTRIAAIMLSQSKKVQIINLDNIKTGAGIQIDAYMKILGLKVLHGLKEWKKSFHNNEKQIFLIDTPGIENVKDQIMQDILLNKNENTKIAIVLPAFYNAPDAQEIVKRFYSLNPQTIIISHADNANRLGGGLNAALISNIALSMFSASSNLADGLSVITPSIIFDLLYSKMLNAN